MGGVKGCALMMLTWISFPGVYMDLPVYVEVLGIVTRPILDSDGLA